MAFKVFGPSWKSENFASVKYPLQLFLARCHSYAILLWWGSILLSTKEGMAFELFRLSKVGVQALDKKYLTTSIPLLMPT